MVNFIVVVILVLGICAAIKYIIKLRRNGHKCIGCPSGCNCSGEVKCHDMTRGDNINSKIDK